MPRPTTAIEVLPHRAVVTRVKPSWNGVSVVACEQIALEHDALAEPEAAGAELKAALRAAGLTPKGPVLGVLGRGRAIVRPVALDEGMAELPELPDIVRLEVVEAASAVEGNLAVDFVPPPPGVRVLVAVGARERDVDALTRVLKAAGAKPASVAVRPVALPTLAPTSMTADSGSMTLVVAVSEDGADLAAVAGGRLIAARPCVDVGRGLVDAVAVEAERLAFVAGGERRFMGCRVVGRPDLCASLVSALAPTIHGAIETELPEAHPVTCPDDLLGADAVVHAGLLAATEEQSINLLAPRRAPDPQEGTRRVALLATLGLVVVFGTAGLLAYKDLAGLGAQRAALMRTAQSANDEYREVLRSRARVEHLEAIHGATDHQSISAELAELHARLPGPDGFLLDSVSIRRSTEVGFAPRRSGSRRWYSGGDWRSDATSTVVLSAQTEDRTVGSGVRGGLIDEGVYDVRPRGADVEGRFEIELARPLGDVARAPGEGSEGGP